MKKLYEESKKQILSKLEYFKKIIAAVADIAKSFAALIASLVAGITAGVTGYFEIKKVFRKEMTQTKASESSSSTETVRSGVTTTVETTIATPASSTLVSVPYSLDMNSGAFLISMVILGFFAISKFRKKND
jgi:hypothetical protein